MGAEAARPAAAACRSLRMSRPIISTGACRPIVAVDRDTAARFGITAATIDNALYDAFGQRIISTIFTAIQPVPRDPGGRSGRCRTRSPRSRRSICRPPAAARCRCRAFANVETRPVPLEIDHLGQFPAAMISFDVAPGYSLGSAVDAVQQAAKADRHAAGHHHELPRRGARVPVGARQRVAADPGRHRHRLYRAGRAV